MSQIRSLTSSSRVGRPYAAGSKANSRAAGFIGSLSIRFLANQAAGIDMHELRELLQTQRRLEQFQQGALAGEIWSMRSKQQPLDGDRTLIIVEFALDE